MRDRTLLTALIAGVALVGCLDPRPSPQANGLMEVPANLPPAAKFFDEVLSAEDQILTERARTCERMSSPAAGPVRAQGVTTLNDARQARREARWHQWYEQLHLSFNLISACAWGLADADPDRRLTARDEAIAAVRALETRIHPNLSTMGEAEQPRQWAQVALAQAFAAEAAALWSDLFRHQAWVDPSAASPEVFVTFGADLARIERRLLNAGELLHLEKASSSRWPLATADFGRLRDNTSSLMAAAPGGFDPSFGPDQYRVTHHWPRAVREALNRSWDPGAFELALTHHLDASAIANWTSDARMAGEWPSRWENSTADLRTPGAAIHFADGQRWMQRVADAPHAGLDGVFRTYLESIGGYETERRHMLRVPP